MMVAMANIVWMLLNATCHWANACALVINVLSRCHKTLAATGLTLGNRKRRLPLLRVCECEVLSTHLALRIRASRPITPTACQAAWLLARKRQRRDLRMLRPERSIVTLAIVKSIAWQFELVAASRSDAIRISTTLSRAFHCPSKAVGFPSEPCSHAHPFGTSCSDKWVCTCPTSTSQGVELDHG